MNNHHINGTGSEDGARIGYESTSGNESGDMYDYEYVVRNKIMSGYGYGISDGHCNEYSDGYGKGYGAGACKIIKKLNHNALKNN